MNIYISGSKHKNTDTWIYIAMNRLTNEFQLETAMTIDVILQWTAN